MNIYTKYEKETKINNKKKKNLANINIVFDARNNAVKFIEGYRLMTLEAKRLEKQGIVLKTLTPK